MREWLRESQEATKELLKLKDRLIDVERNVSQRPLLKYIGQRMASVEPQIYKIVLLVFNVYCWLNVYDRPRNLLRANTTPLLSFYT